MPGPTARSLIQPPEPRCALPGTRHSSQCPGAPLTREGSSFEGYCLSSRRLVRKGLWVNTKTRRCTCAGRAKWHKQREGRHGERPRRAVALPNRTKPAGAGSSAGGPGMCASWRRCSHSQPAHYKEVALLRQRNCPPAVWSLAQARRGAREHAPSLFMTT